MAFRITIITLAQVVEYVDGGYGRFRITVHENGELRLTTCGPEFQTLADARMYVDGFYSALRLTGKAHNIEIVEHDERAPDPRLPQMLAVLMLDVSFDHWGERDVNLGVSSAHVDARYDAAYEARNRALNALTEAELRLVGGV